MITTSAWAKALYPGVNAFWGRSQAAWKPEWVDLFDVEDMGKRAFAEDVSTSGFGLASVKTEGGGISFDTEQQGFLTRYSPVVYGLGFVITREMYEDDLYDIHGQRKSESLSFSMNQTKEIVAANVYNRAFNSSFTGTGGVSLLNSAHPNVAGGTFSNILATASDLNEAALEQAYIDIAKYTNDRGLRIAVMPTSLIIPVDSVFLVKRLLDSEKRPGGNDNDINALNAMNIFPKGIKVNHYLTDSDAWFIRTNVPHGMKYWQRRNIEFTMDTDPDTENVMFKATERYAVGWTDPKALFGSPGS